MPRPFIRKPPQKYGGYLICMKDAFDVPPGKPLMDFVQEMRQLDEGDREFFTTELAKLGYNVIQ